MKKILYIICAIFALTSCSKEELPMTDGQNPDGSYTFNIGIEEPDYAPQSRATVTMGRYLLEMYEGSLSATPVKMENATGVFKVELKKGVDYVCLFWADGGAADYDATNLKAVKQTDETKTGTAAYCAGVTVNSKTFNGAIKLKRAVAELSFIDKNGLTDASNTLKITYPYASATLNVSDGTVTYAAGTAVRTITGITPPAQATDAFTTDFVLAPTAAGKLTGLKFQLNSEEEKTIAETAVQANYRTKITGEYQPKPELKIGSFYYSDNTFSNTPDATKTCLGIVFVVNADGKTGKIVSLDEVKKVWSTETIDTGATNDTDGAVNTAKVLALDSYMADNTKYPAFAWCEAKNATATAGISWYIPAKEELKALYGKYTGDTNIDNSVKTVVNASLSSVSGASQLSDWYLSSTQFSDLSAWAVNINTGNASNSGKRASNSFRVVSAFDLDAQPAPEPVEAKVGDFYMKDGTWLPGATELTPQQQADCIGIVYWLGNPTANDAALRAAHPGCTNGLVVSLKEDGTSAWQSTYAAYDKTVNEWTIANTNYAPIISGGELTDPINKIMGYNNTKAILAFNTANSANKVEAIEKVATYQTTVPTPTSNSGWFLPSEKELTLLCGLANQNSNVYDDSYGTANRDAMNAQLAKIDGAAQITATNYWSSTELSDYGAWIVDFTTGSTSYYLKNFNGNSVRVVSAF